MSDEIVVEVAKGHSPQPFDSRPPYSGLVRTGTSRDGSATYISGSAAHPIGDGAALPETPRWRYVGIQSPQYVFGELTWKNQVRASDTWPRDPNLEPVNAGARQVAEYYAKYKNHPHLPTRAWDSERNRVNEIPADELAAAPYQGQKIAPQLITRDESKPSAHVEARIAKQVRRAP